MKVFVFDPLWPSLITPELERQLKDAGADVTVTTAEAPLQNCAPLFAGDEEKILAVNPDYVGWKLPAEKFEKIKNLKAIVTQSTSFGWIDTNHAAQNGTAVVNIRNFSTDAVAEWAIMMMLNVARRIPLLIKNDFPLNFADDFQTYQGANLKGKKAGIVGLGNIGRAVAERCAGLGMEVVYWNKSPKSAPFKAESLETLFATSDVIFPCMADTPETHGIITDAHIAAMKPTSLFISIVHKYYNHDLLLERIEKGTLFGYAYEADPAAFNAHKGNVWAAPAYAWCTDGSMRQSMDMFVQAIIDATKGSYPNIVNKAA